MNGDLSNQVLERFFENYLQNFWCLTRFYLHVPNHIEYYVYEIVWMKIFLNLLFDTDSHIFVSVIAVPVVQFIKKILCMRKPRANYRWIKPNSIIDTTAIVQAIFTCVICIHKKKQHPMTSTKGIIQYQC